MMVYLSSFKNIADDCLCATESRVYRVLHYKILTPVTHNGECKRNETWNIMHTNPINKQASGSTFYKIYLIY